MILENTILDHESLMSALEADIESFRALQLYKEIFDGLHWPTKWPWGDFPVAFRSIESFFQLLWKASLHQPILLIFRFPHMSALEAHIESFWALQLDKEIFDGLNWPTKWSWGDFPVAFRSIEGSIQLHEKPLCTSRFSWFFDFRTCPHYKPT